MTSIIDISEDILRIVFSILTFKEQIAFRETAVSFCKASNLIKIKVGRINYMMTTYRFSGRCINAECITKLGWRVRPSGSVERWAARVKQPPAMGLTTFYYPKELMPPHDYEGDPYGLNYEFRHRLGNCERGYCVERLIPYCVRCMVEFVNVGERNDELDVPYMNRKGITNL